MVTLLNADEVALVGAPIIPHNTSENEYKDLIVGCGLVRARVPKSWFCWDLVPNTCSEGVHGSCESIRLGGSFADWLCPSRWVRAGAVPFSLGLGAGSCALQSPDCMDAGERVGD